MEFYKFVFCCVVSTIVLVKISMAITQPHELDKMLKTGKYEEFSKITRVPLNIAKPMYLDVDIIFQLNSEQVGDMMMLPEQLVKIKGKKGLYQNGFFFGKWDRYVPYAILPTNYSIENIQTIERRIRSFNSHFPGVIEFRRQRPDDEDYVVFFNGNGCFSHSGKLGGIQAISLKKDQPLASCLTPGYSHHEMMHTIGMMHTNSRLDRDLYIKNNPQNIPEDFHKLYLSIFPNTSAADPTKEYFELEGPYEYRSLMHLAPTLQPDQKPFYEVLRSDIDPKEIGDINNLDLTDLDVAMVKNYYSRDSISPKRENTRFLRKNRH